MKTKTLTEIKDRYILDASIYENEEIRLSEKKEFRLRQAERLEKRIKKLKRPNWVDHLIKPLADELLKHFPEYEKYELLGPSGIRASLSIHFFKKTQEEIGYDNYFKKDNLVSITLIPVDLEKAEFEYETGEVTNEFSKNTLGETNGMNNVTAPFNDIETLIKFLNKKLLQN